MELVTNGKALLMIHRRPAAYERPRNGKLGPRQLRWIADQGWLSGPRVERRVERKEA
jgi:hypothetical protein